MYVALVRADSRGWPRLTLPDARRRCCCNHTWLQQAQAAAPPHCCVALCTLPHWTTPNPAPPAASFPCTMQAGIKPPTFVLFCNDAKLFPDDYRKYIERQFRCAGLNAVGVLVESVGE